jgi:hypothetical protein
VHITILPANTFVVEGAPPIHLTADFSFVGDTAATDAVPRQVNWTSSDQNIATITNEGLATPVGRGTVTLTATSGPAHLSTTLTVIPALAIGSIAIMPANASSPKGIPLLFTLTATFADNSTQDVTSAGTWSTSNSNVAVMNGATAITLGTGSTVVTAQFDGLKAGTTFQVTPPIVEGVIVKPNTPNLPLGLDLQFSAIGTMSDNTEQNLSSLVTWTSSRTGVATVNSSGLASSHAQGSSIISATYSNITASGALNVVSPTKFSQQIHYIVIIVQENRTPDNLFHGLPNADIANSGINSAGQAVPLSQLPLINHYDLDHSHGAFNTMYDKGKMDGGDKVVYGCVSGTTCSIPPNPQFQYVNPSDVAPYFQLAEQYTFGDRMFESSQGPSFPAHQFLFAATSSPESGYKWFAAESPVLPPGVSVYSERGCNAPVGTLVALIAPDGIQGHPIYPCLEHLTLGDLLDQQSFTWRYYDPAPALEWAAPNAIQHIRFGPDWDNVVPNNTQFFSDVANHQLAQVSWVIPAGQSSDHPGTNDGSGPSWVASIVNAIGNSSYWANTATLITWDDWGGWYDHVAPPIYNQFEDGFRVPLIVVSPYAKKGYVSHVTHDFGSFISFAESVFGLPSLGFADAHADDLSDCFDLTQTPSAFKTIPAKLGASYFVTNKSAPLPADDD